jgi:hypothetical protein
VRSAVPLAVVAASAQELAAHEAMLAIITKASGGRCLWAAEVRDIPTGECTTDAQRSSA